MNLKQSMYVCLLMSGLVVSNAMLYGNNYSESQPAHVQVYKHITARMGQEIIIELDANVTTGYQWEIVHQSKKLQLISQTFVTNEIVGAGCKEVIKFVASKPGKAKVSFAYRRPWENGAPLKMITYKITVNVDWKPEPTRGN